MALIWDTNLIAPLPPIMDSPRKIRIPTPQEVPLKGFSFWITCTVRNSQNLETRRGIASKAWSASGPLRTPISQRGSSGHTQGSPRSSFVILIRICSESASKTALSPFTIWGRPRMISKHLSIYLLFLCIVSMHCKFGIFICTHNETHKLGCLIYYSLISLLLYLLISLYFYISIYLYICIYYDIMILWYYDISIFL